MTDGILSLTGVGKHFGAVTALGDINLRVGAGEIVALIGDNGAGKSTLMNIICGADAVDEGVVRVNGEPLRNLTDANRLGVGVVYQDLALAPHMTVAENMYLGTELTRRLGPFRVLDRRGMSRDAKAAITELGISTLHNVSMPVDRLSGGQRQVLGVARAIKRAKSLILLDEPTAALGPKQVGIVLQAIEAASNNGLGVVLVSHDIPSVLKLAHRVVILRHGTIFLDRKPDGMSVSDVMTAMVGDE